MYIVGKAKTEVRSSNVPASKYLTMECAFSSFIKYNNLNKNLRNIWIVFRKFQSSRCFAGTFQGLIVIAGTKSTSGGLNL